MPKHKKDKHAKSITKGLGQHQPGVPPAASEPAVKSDGVHASQQHDAARRLGGFEGTGNHARTGNPGHQ
jgi:hypothetical protein